MNLLPSQRTPRIFIGGAALLCALASVCPAQSTPAARAQTVNTLADQLQSRYVMTETGKKYAEMLRRNLAAGKYDGLPDLEALAARLTSDLQAVAPDSHIKVSLEAKLPAGMGPRRGPPGEVDVPSVAEAKWIADGVAYIRFNQFAGEPASLELLEKFMRGHANARAIIFDTRNLTRGGGLAEMDVIFPYLFDRETPLVTMEVAKASLPGGRPPPGADDTLRVVEAPPNLLRRTHVAKPHPTEHGLAKAKVFYLTSPKTRSAGEHFALALQASGRGLIVGERTAGANHFGGYQPIGEGLVAFIPIGRTYHPKTGKDWEGDGIKPDVEVPADQALDKALELAGK